MIRFLLWIALHGGNHTPLNCSFSINWNIGGCNYSYSRATCNLVQSAFSYYTSILFVGTVDIDGVRYAAADLCMASCILHRSTAYKLGYAGCVKISWPAII